MEEILDYTNRWFLYHLLISKSLSGYLNENSASSALLSFNYIDARKTGLEK